MSQALTDAAVVYGAQRYFDRLHTKPDWKYSGSFRQDDDRLLFLELLHDIILYDSIILDNSSLEEDVSIDLISFANRLNEEIGFDWIEFENVGFKARVDAEGSKHYFCNLLKEILLRDSEARFRISVVPVPWAYKDRNHHDRDYFIRKMEQFAMPIDIVPFAIYVWRAITYQALASYKVKLQNKRLAYVAAPGRLVALQAVLDRSDVRRYGLPRDLIKEIRWRIPEFPSGGYDFTFLNSLPVFATSPIANYLADAPPEEALREVCAARDSEQAHKIRDDWSDILFEASNYAAVGGVNIMIMKDVSASGSITQNQFIRAVPRETEDMVT
jgi:hypothetical protein